MISNQAGVEIRELDVAMLEAERSDTSIGSISGAGGPASSSPCE